MIAILSLIIMPFIAFMKYDTGKKLNSRSLVADSKQTYTCVVMTIMLLLGLSLNYFYGIWWVDPLTGLAISFFLFKEGYGALKEKELCSC